MREAFRAAISVLIVWAAFAFPSAADAATPPGFSASTVFDGLTYPTAFRLASDGRVFVAEKSGLVLVFNGLSDPTPDVFADLRTQVFNDGDRGLLGLALHPNFPTTPFVYVLYTYDKDPFVAQMPRWGTPGATTDNCPTPPGPNTDGCVVSGRLSRLAATGNVSGPEQVLITDWCQQFSSHTVGSLAFGADGMLYVSAGDGASYNFTDWGNEGDPPNPCGDPPAGRGGDLAPPDSEGGALRSHDVRTSGSGDPTGYDGTILRINPDGSAAAGNPLISSSDQDARRIVATGFRNPFRFALRPGTNEVWIGDVGWNDWEEINRLSSGPAGEGRNFGWPCYEGNGRQPSYDASGLTMCEQLYAGSGSATNLISGTATGPYYSYDHSEEVVSGEPCPTGSASVSGLAFYNGGPFPDSYDGALFFADYSRECIWAMKTGGGSLPSPANLETFVSDAGAPVELQVGPDGSLYYSDIIAGEIRRIEYSDTNRPPNAVASANPTSGPPPLAVQFDASGTSDPDGDTLSYAWDLDADGSYDDSTQIKPTRTYNQAGSYDVGLKVSDDEGGTDTASVTIDVGNTPPEPHIVKPGSTTMWGVDERIEFEGLASDNEDGTLDPSALDWDLILHHCPSTCHQHPAGGLVDGSDGEATGSFAAPDHEYPAHLELSLTATDSDGRSGSSSMTIPPETLDLTLDSVPRGLDLTIGATTAEAPFSATVIDGSTNSIAAESPQALGDQLYAWQSWSDGGARAHTIVASASATYTATFGAIDWPPALPGFPGFGAPGLYLEVDAKRRQSPRDLAVEAQCPMEPCEVTAAGRAKGVRFELENGASLEAGVAERLELHATKRRELDRLERRLARGVPRKPVVAKIELAGTDLVEGVEAVERIRVRMKP